MTTKHIFNLIDSLIDALKKTKYSRPQIQYLRCRKKAIKKAKTKTEKAHEINVLKKTLFGPGAVTDIYVEPNETTTMGTVALSSLIYSAASNLYQYHGMR